MTIHASANRFPGPVRSTHCAALPSPLPSPIHGPVAGSYWNSISDPDLTPVSCVVRCLGVWPSQDSGVRVPPRPVSQSNLATRL